MYENRSNTCVSGGPVRMLDGFSQFAGNETFQRPSDLPLPTCTVRCSVTPVLALARKVALGCCAIIMSISQ